MISAYCIFKRPNTFDNVEPFLEAVLRIPGPRSLYTRTPPKNQPSRSQRQNPESNSVFASLMFKKAYIGQYSGFRPDRTALRKTPRGWLPSNLIQKDHAGSVLIARKQVNAPFLVGVYDLGMGKGE